MSTIFLFVFNDTATTEIYTLSLHDALPILPGVAGGVSAALYAFLLIRFLLTEEPSPEPLNILLNASLRSEEHTSELQSRQYLVCRLLLEKKKSRKSPARSATPASLKAKSSR